MGGVRKPFLLGNLSLASNIFCAPLAGCSDLPFRRMTSRYRPGLIYCEMVKMEAIIRHDPGTFRLLDYEKEMHPIGAQIVGANPKIAGKAAQIVEELGFDVIDLNCGCPVDKVTKDGSGSGLLKEPEKIGEIIANMVAAVDVPVTVKIRTGWNEEMINAVEVTEIAEQAGAAAITIHGRTRAQGYTGNADWDHIRACKEKADKILVIGNGDVFDAQSALNMFSHTGCDAILLSRGTMGGPHLIEEIYRLAETGEEKVRDEQEIEEIFQEHFAHVCQYASEKKALIDLRRISCWYLKKMPNAKKRREELMKAKSLEQVHEILARAK